MYQLNVPEKGKRFPPGGPKPKELGGRSIYRSISDLEEDLSLCKEQKDKFELRCQWYEEHIRDRRQKQDIKEAKSQGRSQMLSIFIPMIIILFFVLYHF